MAVDTRGSVGIQWCLDGGGASGWRYRDLERRQRSCSERRESFHIEAIWQRRVRGPDPYQHSISSRSGWSTARADDHAISTCSVHAPFAQVSPSPPCFPQPICSLGRAVNITGVDRHRLTGSRTAAAHAALQRPSSADSPFLCSSGAWRRLGWHLEPSPTLTERCRP